MMKKIFIINLLILGFISCGTSDDKPKEVDNCKDVICGSGYSCDQDLGKCKLIENFCLNDSQCKEGEKCNRTINLCESLNLPTGCQNHEDCKVWEKCNFDTSECLPREGMCNISDSCTTPPFLICNVRTHKCTDPGSCLYNSCEKYEICKSDEICHLRDGFCTIDQNCSSQFPYDVCNTETNLCERPVVECESMNDCNLNYQFCDINTGAEIKLCKASEGKCRSNLDCIENPKNGSKKTCDKETYTCILSPENNCKLTGCNYWESCNELTGECLLPENRCNNDNDCTEAREVCNAAHYCEPDDCTTHGCDWWKHCIRETGECKLYDAMCDTDNDCIDHAPHTVCTPLLHSCGKGL